MLPTTRTLAVSAAIAAIAAVCIAADVASDPLTRAKALVAQMTLDEKLQFVQGNTTYGRVSRPGYTGVVKGVERLGVPDMLMNDGPQGFRSSDDGTSTQWPSGLSLARSWDRALFLQCGTAMGAEFYGKGANVQFGPGVNVARVANGGRSFEYLSGEDPFLGYELVQPIVKGVQSQGVVATTKHYMDNNQEGYHGQGDRHSTNEVVDERTQMELYFPPFEGSVVAGGAALMCANNLVNGQYVCQNEFVEKVMMKNWTGFKGWVCSDYDGTRSAIQAANNGLDIAMPGPPTRPDYFGSLLRGQIKAGTVTEATITDKAVRAVYSLAVVGALDTPNPNNSSNDVTSPAHYALARKLAVDSYVLLQNKDNVLPLKRSANVALIGWAGSLPGIFGGSGSGRVVPKHKDSIWDTLRPLCQASGAQCTQDNADDLSAAQKLARKADVAVVVLWAFASEGLDRTTLDMNQTEVVAGIAAAQPNTVVVTVSPGPYLTPWANVTKAIVDMGYPGEMGPEALWDVLYGAVTPSGKMPHTMPNVWNETRFSWRQYPGIPPDKHSGLPACSSKPRKEANFTPCSPTMAYYDEKLEVGYRWYAANDVKVGRPRHTRRVEKVAPLDSAE